MAIAMGWIFRDPHLPYCCTTGVQPLTGRGHHAQQSQFHQQIDLALERVLKNSITTIHLKSKLPGNQVTATFFRFSAKILT